MPISMLTTTMTPKWIGSIPRAVATGKRMGAVIRMMDEGSMMFPASSRRMFTTTKKPMGPSPVSTSQVARA